MAFRPIPTVMQTTLTLVLALTCSSTSLYAATGENTLPFGIRFEVPESYCEIADSSPQETAFKARVRQRDESNTLVASLFADCEQKRTWNSDPDKAPTRFGAAFLHRTGGSFRPISAPRQAYLERLAAQLNSDQASFKYTVDLITKGALDARLESARVLAATSTAIFIGFTAVTTSENGSERMLTGISAYTLIKTVQVTLHLYRESDESAEALLPEAAAIMLRWIELNDSEQDPPLWKPVTNAIDPRVRVEIPAGYCEISDTSQRERELLSRTRRERQFNMVLLALFADCEELPAWRNNTIRQLTRYGAAFILKSSGSVHPVAGSREEYLTKLERILSSTSTDWSKRLLERIVTGPIDIQPKRSQVLWTNSTGIYIGQIAEETSDQGSTTLAGMSAITLINHIPVTVHFYRPFEDERSIRSLWPLTMRTIIAWTRLNEGDGRQTVAKADNSAKPDSKEAEEKQHQSPATPPPAPSVTEGDQEPKLVNSAENIERSKNLALLTNGAFDELSRKLAAEQTAFERDKMPEELLVNSYLAFASANPKLKKHLDNWTKRQPKSFAPYLARGIYHWHLGWTSRGEAAASVTPAERFALMSHYFKKSKADIEAALAIRPNVAMAWATLINIATTSGQRAAEIYDEAIEAAPKSVYLRLMYAFSFHPSWGGGIAPAEWMKYAPRPGLIAVTDRNVRWYKFYTDLQRDAATVPALRPVIESPEYESAKHAFARVDYGTAMLNLIKALALDHAAAKHLSDGDRLAAKGEYEAAIQEFDQATQPGSAWMETVRRRAQTLRNKGYKAQSFAAYRMALDDYQIALALDPYNPDLLTDAVVALREIPVLFPQRGAEFKKLWRLPSTCKTEPARPRQFTIVHVSAQRPESVKIFCAVESLLDKALIYGSSDLNVREMRGILYLYAFRLPDRAAVEFAKAIALDDRIAKIWANYAVSLHEIGDCRAIAAYKKYIEMCADGSCDKTSVSINRSRLAEISTTCDK